jgi:hypothetical protein
MLNSIRQCAELMCNISRLETEQEYWYLVLNLVNTSTGIWLSQIDYDVLKKNSINWDQTKTKTYIKHLHEFYELKLRNTRNRLRSHLKQSFPLYGHSENKISQNHILQVIYNALDILVENSLYYFRLNFKQKTTLLKYDITAANLVKSFYELNPTDEQVLQKLFYIFL